VKIAAAAWARTCLQKLLALESAILLAAFAILILVTFADVALRTITGSGLMWSRDVGIYANIWLSMLGIGIASSQGSHLRPRFMDSWVRADWQAWLPRVQELLAAAGFLVLAVIAAQVVADTRELGDTNSMLRWPIWICQLCMPLALGFAAFKHSLFALYPALRPEERDETSEAPRE
jgi:TRAP-type C4-dicarboxylate transport system permease small subunit